MLEHKEKLKNFFRDIVSEMITNLRNIGIDDKIKIRKSLEVNGVIRNIKIDKGISNSIFYNKNFGYKILLSPRSNYIKRNLGFDVFYILKEVLDNSEDSKTIFDYVSNELFNILNYGRTSVKILSSESYFELCKIYKPILHKYQLIFRCNTNTILLANDLDTSMISKNLKLEGEYKVMYVKPNKAFTETSIDDLEVKEFAMPVIIDYDGDPINKALWNVCYNVNSKYKTSLAIRCLVPIGITINSCKVLNTRIMHEEINKYYKNNISKIPERHYNKLSIMIISTVDTILNKPQIYKGAES